MAFFSRDDSSSIEYVDAIPKNEKTAKQKRMWKWIAIAVAIIVVIIVVVVVSVVVTQQNKSKDSSSSGSGTSNSQYPISPYAHMTTIVTNNDESLQQKENIYVVGDVHGCVSELDKLVTKLNFNPATDQLILAGDLTAKGPDSVGVIRRAKELGALCVRGNHDDKVIRLKTYELEKGENAMYPVSATMPEGNVPDPLKFKNYHVAIAKNLTQDDYDYLSSCPVMLHMPFLNNAVVVHGGLDPNISSLQDQIPYLVMNMRDIDKNGPSPENNVGTQWGTVWNEKQQNLTMDNTEIFYGHDASRGLNLKNATFGLDTGCVYGNQLTAMNVRTKVMTQIECPLYVKQGGTSDD
ncbi:ser/thr protein phosphatase family [Mucor ambiguus]|uniref:Ser/thr protein phosphatase family n=1 Tax=Mucor ambiguus TaxID=91626 RepID=A0A0C9MLT2_9FUNG|nr:ser/thr protein phosphatase family [Mucor ambiguus]